MSSFTTTLPWMKCGNSWNTLNCYDGTNNTNLNGDGGINNTILNNTSIYNHTKPISSAMEYFE